MLAKGKAKQYTVKEIFYSLQGEGYNTGRPAIFIRFSGCNLWSGRAKDKDSSPCFFCDTDFMCGGKYSAKELAKLALGLWEGGGMPFIVFTGGEPTLQLDDTLLDEFMAQQRQSKSTCDFAVETNGTTSVEYKYPIWWTVSPKTKDFTRRKGGELKLLYHLSAVHPDEVTDLDFKYKYLQPLMGDDYESNLKSAIQKCLDSPAWRLSLQTHKILGVR